MKEKDIMYEAGRYWVLREPDKYTVVRMGATHGVSDSAYDKTEGGLSVAKARCDYLHNRWVPNAELRGRPLADGPA